MIQCYELWHLYSNKETEGSESGNFKQKIKGINKPQNRPRSSVS